MVWVEATVTYQGKTTRTRCPGQQSQGAVRGGAAQGRDVQRHRHQAERTERHLRRRRGRQPRTRPVPRTRRRSPRAGRGSRPCPASYAEVGQVHDELDLPTWRRRDQHAVARDHDQRLGRRRRHGLQLRARAVGHAGGRTFDSVIIQPGTVGFLSDYFDQAAQASLADESQAGGTPAVAPTSRRAPWTITGFTTIDTTTRQHVAGHHVDDGVLDCVEPVQERQPHAHAAAPAPPGAPSRSTAAVRLRQPHSHGTGRGDLHGDLYVGGTLTINNTTTTTVSDDFGPCTRAGPAPPACRAG